MRRPLTLALALCIFALADRTDAQTPAPTPKTTKGKSTSSSSTSSTTVDHLAAARRTLAVSLINSVADEARDYRDETLRARVQARVADALWDTDAERARTLFRRAWDAAETLEKNVQTAASALGKISSTRPPRPRTNLRSEILRLAARRDHALGEEFFAKLTAARDDESKSGGGSSNDSAPTSLSPFAAAERLRLAEEFLESGNVERALQFAGPALANVSERAIGFLVNLRERNAPAADERFAEMLARAASDPSSDANTVSLLTSYAFTPSIFLAVSPEGFPSSMNYAPRPAPDLAPVLRAAFFRTAARILVRPLNELDQTSAGRGGTYYIIARLLPLFEQHATDDAPRLRAQLAALRPDAPKHLAGGDTRDLDRGISPEDPASDKIREELDGRLDRARNADERDRAYAFAAMRSAEAGDARAREFADKIEDLDTRAGIRRFVEYSFVGALLRKKDVEEALRIARKSDMTPAQRTWVLRRAAELLAEQNRARALELLEESLTEARRLDVGTPERAYALTSVAAQLSKLDRARAWEVLGETVKAANAVAGFTGENGMVQFRLEGKFSIQLGLEIASDTDLSNSFAALAETDLQRAVETAKGFSGEAPRALASIAVARAVLEGGRGRKAR